jgi:hypothetical protein
VLLQFAPQHEHVGERRRLGPDPGALAQAGRARQTGAAEFLAHEILEPGRDLRAALGSSRPLSASSA